MTNRDKMDGEIGTNKNKSHPLAGVVPSPRFESSRIFGTAGWLLNRANLGLSNRPGQRCRKDGSFCYGNNSSMER